MERQSWAVRKVRWKKKKTAAKEQKNQQQKPVKWQSLYLHSNNEHTATHIPMTHFTRVTFECKVVWKGSKSAPERLRLQGGSGLRRRRQVAGREREALSDNIWNMQRQADWLGTDWLCLCICYRAFHMCTALDPPPPAESSRNVKHSARIIIGAHVALQSRASNQLTESDDGIREDSLTRVEI